MNRSADEPEFVAQRVHVISDFEYEFAALQPFHGPG
jgi:hypothetical protein